MKEFRKFTTRFLSLTLAAVMSLFAGISASAKPAYQWGIDFSAANPEDHYGWNKNGKTIFSVDSKVHTDNSFYSIKLENTDYTDGCVEKTYDVEPNTAYKFSAMVKYSGYQPDPNEKNKKSGACVGEAFHYDPEKKIYVVPNGQSAFSNSSDWTLLEYEFNTGNKTACNLRLQNGTCKGTAWFSDVKLEKVEMTNSWNILAVFFRNVDANVVLEGKQVRFRQSLTESKISDINKYALDTLSDNLKNLSNGKMTVNSIDRYYSDEALTEKDLTLTASGNGYCIDPSASPVVSKVLDKYLAQKEYHQIIIFVPFYNPDGKSLGDGWWGLGGSSYKRVYFAQISDSWEGAFEKGDHFPGQVLVHEMCHCLSAASKAIDPDKTPDFHSVLKEYPDPNVSKYERIHMFMTATLPGGKGLDPSVFYVSSGKYTLISDDMTTGKGIEPGSSSVTPPAPTNFRAESVSDKNITFNWDTVPNADSYQFVRFKDAGFKEMARDPADLDSDGSTTWGPYERGRTYYFGIRTVASINGATVFSDWTTLTFTHYGVGGEIVHGDVNSNGKFDLADITAALKLFINGSSVDQRTLEAIGVGENGTIKLSDVSRLLKEYVNS